MKWQKLYSQKQGPRQPGPIPQLLEKKPGVCDMLLYSNITLQVDHRNSPISIKMSGGLDACALKEEDVTKFLGCSTHLGASNVDFQMEQYVYKRKPEGLL